MRSQRSGHIINMSSVGGYASFSGWGIYCARKFAVEGISEALSIELAPLGIHATVVEPGYFRTDFLSSCRSAFRVGSHRELRRLPFADVHHRPRAAPPLLSGELPSDKSQHRRYPSLQRLPPSGKGSSESLLG